MNRLDTEIKIITKGGKPQAITVNGFEIPCVTAFNYNADGSLNVTLYGNVKFEEELKINQTFNITTPVDIDANLFQEELLKAMKQGATCTLQGAY